MFRRMAEENRSHKAQEFPIGFTWLNTERPLPMNDSKGHVVVLDFWTYCCINCMHTLPTLEWLEKKYRNEPVVFIGVHSAKFLNEQQVQNVQEAINRYEINHPVVVDQEMKIWQSYNVTAWPTIVIVDPKGNIVYQKAGEGQRDELDDIISVLLDQHRATATLAKEPIVKGHPKPTSTRILSYPGKLAFSPDGTLLAISDSNNNRVIIVDAPSGRIFHKVGGIERGLRDGGFEEACFFRPQGLTWADNKTIYVADTENHALRKIDISTKTVRTLAGDGRQGIWVSGAQDGTMTRLSSPWDIAYLDGFLFVAMAGLHQIWAYHVDSGKIGPFAGSGYENIVDGTFAEAQFAQPSGISIFSHFLLVADSEVSAVRLLDFKKKAVRTIVGKGLFEFGYKDGPLAAAKLQHPLGVHCAGNKIYVADTYNHAVRLIDLDKQEVMTVIGKAGKSSMMCKLDDPACETLGLFEPSDVKQRENVLYIADTNNHLVRTFDLDKMVLKTFDIKEEEH